MQEEPNHGLATFSKNILRNHFFRKTSQQLEDRYMSHKQNIQPWWPQKVIFRESKGGPVALFSSFPVIFNAKIYILLESQKC